MTKYFDRHHKFFSAWLAAIALLSIVFLNFSVSARTASVNTPQNKQQINLKEGQIVVTGEQGQYTGKLLVKAPLKIVWEVLTDYDNFKLFLPNVAKSELLKSNGNKKVFEQVNVARILFFSEEARIRIETTETYPQQIAFRAIEGDIKSLQGVWRFKALSDRILIEHQVTIDPGPEDRDLFFAIYKDNLEDTLKAIRKEIKRRSPSS